MTYVHGIPLLDLEFFVTNNASTSSTMFPDIRTRSSSVLGARKYLLHIKSMDTTNRTQWARFQIPPGPRQGI